MLKSLKELEGYTVRATDGVIGTVSNFLLDDFFLALHAVNVTTVAIWVGHGLLRNKITLAAVGDFTQTVAVQLRQQIDLHHLGHRAFTLRAVAK